MTDSDDYDQDFTEIRMNIAKEQNEWFIFFKFRDQYIRLMILSFFAVWLILGTISILLKVTVIVLFFIPNIVWIIICLPYFAIKINNISKVINSKKEEVVVNLWKTKTHDIKEIMLLTGLERNFIEFYLEKNRLIKRKSKPAV